MLKNIVSPFLLPGLLMATLFLCKPEKANTLESGITDTGEAFEPVVVLQLFTSQGCSSCPPADALLKRLEESPGHESLFCVAYHVDYWDYIGWEDPFSRPGYTEKQKMYAAKFRNSRVYTPQMVINGKEHLVGSDATRITSRIREYRKEPSSNSIKVTAGSINASDLRLDYEVLGPLSGRKIRAVLVLDESITNVKRGENRDKSLINTNIAIMEGSKTLNASRGSLILKAPVLDNTLGSYHLVVLTETENLDITGAARTRITGE